VAQADAEHRHLAEQAADLADGAGDRRGVARAVGQEHPVGLRGQHLVGAGRRGHHLDGGELAQVAQDRGLDAEVVGARPGRGPLRRTV
jgi:hypothetical protein